MDQERQVEQSKLLSARAERERIIAAASTFQGQLCGRETKGCRLWRPVASGCQFCLLLWVGLQGRILHIVIIFQDSKFWEAFQHCDKPNLKNCDRWISKCWKLRGLSTQRNCSGFKYPDGVKALWSLLYCEWTWYLYKGVWCKHNHFCMWGNKKKEKTKPNCQLK